MADLKFEATDKGQRATKTKSRMRVLQTSRDSVCAHICDVHTMAAALMMRKYRTDRSGRYVAPKPLDVNILREYMQLTKRAIAQRKTQCGSGKVKRDSRRHCLHLNVHLSVLHAFGHYGRRFVRMEHSFVVALK